MGSAQVVQSDGTERRPAGGAEEQRQHPDLLPSSHAGSGASGWSGGMLGATSPSPPCPARGTRLYHGLLPCRWLTSSKDVCISHQPGLLPPQQREWVGINRARWRALSLFAQVQSHQPGVQRGSAVLCSDSTHSMGAYLPPPGGGAWGGEESRVTRTKLGAGIFLWRTQSSLT